MNSKPQIKCPNCKTSMPFTAAECPKCNRRMVTLSKDSSNNIQTGNKTTLIGGLIAGSIVAVLLMICCSSGNESPEQRRARERQEEMRPVMNEIDRKMSEGKTKEQAAREIVNEEFERQKRREQIEELERSIEEEKKK